MTPRRADNDVPQRQPVRPERPPGDLRASLRVRDLAATVRAADLGVTPGRRKVILAALLTASLTPAQVRALLPSVHHAEVTRIVAGVIEEGLAAREGRSVQHRSYRITDHGRTHPEAW